MECFLVLFKLFYSNKIICSQKIFTIALFSIDISYRCKLNSSNKESKSFIRLPHSIETHDHLKEIEN